MEENEKKAFDFAADTTKQLITISTAIIALMVTFSKDIIGNSIASNKTLLAWTWGVFIASIICGILTLMALTGTLQPKKKKAGSIKDENEALEKKQSLKIDINNRNIVFFSSLQIFLFLGAIMLTAIFGFNSLSTRAISTEEKKKYKVVRKSTLNNDSNTIYIDTLYLIE